MFVNVIVAMFSSHWIASLSASGKSLNHLLTLLIGTNHLCGSWFVADRGLTPQGHIAQFGIPAASASIETIEQWPHAAKYNKS